MRGRPRVRVYVSTIFPPQTNLILASLVLKAFRAGDRACVEGVYHCGATHPEPAFVVVVGRAGVWDG